MLGMVCGAETVRWRLRQRPCLSSGGSGGTYGPPLWVHPHLRAGQARASERVCVTGAPLPAGGEPLLQAGQLVRLCALHKDVRLRHEVLRDGVKVLSWRFLFLHVEKLGAEFGAT